MELFEQSSLKILSPSSLDILETQLNVRKVLTTEEGHLRDYRGLADFIGLSPLHMDKVESNPNHIRELISLWCNLKDLSKTTVQKLIEGLETIERFDVIDDVAPALEKDCVAAQQIGIATVEDVKTDNNALTFQDIEALRRGRKLVKFDSIILHGKDPRDTRLAAHLAERMKAIGKSVFLPERDLLAGTIHHAASAEIIEKRCDRAILILTPSYFESDVNILNTDLVEYLAVVRKQAFRLLPVVISGIRCDNLRETLRMRKKLSYDPVGDTHSYFYEGLFRSLEVDISKLPPETLRYPDQDNVQITNTNVQIPKESQNLPEFTEVENDGYTLVSVRSSELNSMSTTISELNADDVENRASTSASTRHEDFSNSLEMKLPDVPSHEPGSSQVSSSNKKKNPSFNQQFKNFFGKKNTKNKIKQPLLN